MTKVELDVRMGWMCPKRATIKNRIDLIADAVVDVVVAVVALSEWELIK